MRLGLVTPGLFALQVRAIVEATCALIAEGRKPEVEIMVPLGAVIVSDGGVVSVPLGFPGAGVGVGAVGGAGAGVGDGGAGRA